MTYIIINKSYIAHHGIKGQRWGIRRNRQNSSQGTSNNGLRISDKTKRRIKTVVKIGAGVAAAYGAYQLQKYLKTPAGKLLIKKGQKAVNRALRAYKTVNKVKRTVDHIKNHKQNQQPQKLSDMTMDDLRRLDLY